MDPDEALLTGPQQKLSRFPSFNNFDSGILAQFNCSEIWVDRVLLYLILMATIPRFSRPSKRQMLGNPGRV
jgi:hypothetical protein